ncbi:MAG: LrgB family protein, partial [Paraprevotella sp.]|nr:LrgB family protein [Paraprevotella sp.]
MEYLKSNFFLIALTFGVYFLAKRLQARTGWVILNPILLAIAFLIGFLKLTDIPYDTYAKSASIIDFWLQPAIVALGVPLYLQLKSIRRQLLPVLISQLVGCFVGIVSVVLTAKWMGASNAVIISLAPKSVTTPIAMAVTESLNGFPSLSAAIVVLVGLFGAVCG